MSGLLLGHRRLGRRGVAALCVLLGLLVWSSCQAQQDRPAPKNVIVMIADGCGFQHVKAASYYRYGDTGKLCYESFPVHLAMSTFAARSKGYDPAAAWHSFGYVKQGATDSAAAATAMATGVKTLNGKIGVDAEDKDLPNFLEGAAQTGRSTGVITTVPLCHATPAGFSTHDKARGNYAQLAKSMLLSSSLAVVMGAGHPLFDSDAQPLELPKEADKREARFRYVGGEDTWKALVAGTAGNDMDGDGTGDPWRLVQTRADFQALGRGQTPKRVLGVAQVAETLQQARAGDKKADPYVVPLREGVPTLAEMTRAALNVLDDNPKGLAIMIEGGAVDYAAHANQSGRMIEELLAFEDAVSEVTKWVESHGGWGQTLLIVTCDHETGYLTGPGSDPEWKPLVNNGVGKLPGMEWHYVSHTNSLVPFFAKGNGADRLVTCATGQDPIRGAYLDNTDIAKTIFGLLK